MTINKKIESIIAKHPALDIYPNWCWHNGELRLEFHITFSATRHTTDELSVGLAAISKFSAALLVNKRVNSISSSKFDLLCNELRFCVYTVPTSCDVKVYEEETRLEVQEDMVRRKAKLQARLDRLNSEMEELNAET